MKQLKYMLAGILLSVVSIACGPLTDLLAEAPLENDAPPPPGEVAPLDEQQKDETPPAVETEDEDNVTVEEIDAVDNSADDEPLVITELDQVLADLYDAANPATVNIQVAVRGQPLQIPPGFEDLIPPDAVPENGEGRLQLGQGSGFVIDREGYIVTNYHVVTGAEEIRVTFADGLTVEAELLGLDPDSDLAVLKVDASVTQDITPLEIGDSTAIRPGYTVIAIGNPFGLDGTMTVGVVSAVGRTLPSQATTTGGNRFTIPGIIQTDAAINPGNSGGPLLNLNGQVVGVNTAIATNDGQFSGVGYAVPAIAVDKIVPSLIANGEYKHPWLGVATSVLSDPVREAMELEPNQAGVLVSQVVPGSPAEEGGLRGSTTEVTLQGITTTIGGDIVVGIDGNDVRAFEDLIEYLEFETSPDDTITLTVLRDGEEIELEIILGERPAS